MSHQLPVRMPMMGRPRHASVDQSASQRGEEQKKKGSYGAGHKLGVSVSSRRPNHELETGATLGAENHPAAIVVGMPAVSSTRLRFEASRPLWLRECIAECTGVFLYTYCGVASTAGFFLTGSAIGTETTGAGTISNIFQIGCAFSLGIAFAIVICASTSGGQFNPAATLAFAIFRGFPWRKVPRYIISQCLGAFIACALVYGQWKVQFHEYAALMESRGVSLVSQQGPSSVFFSLPPAGQGLGQTILSEGAADFLIALVIWSCLDPTNPFVAASTAPLLIGFAYGVSVWGFAYVGLSTNLARDFGAICWTAVLYGSDAFTFRITPENFVYAPIGILVNVGATLAGVTFYELVLGDLASHIHEGLAVHGDDDERGQEVLRSHYAGMRHTEHGYADTAAVHEPKDTLQMDEHVGRDSRGGSM